MELFKFISDTDPTVFDEGVKINDAKIITWIERYREPGEFEIIAHLSSGLRDFLPTGTFISHTDTYEVMIVESHEVSDQQLEDPVLKITGRSLECYLENRIVGMNQVRASSTVTEYVLSSSYSWNQIVTIINDHIGNATYTDDNLINIVATTTASGTGTFEERSIKREDLYKTVLELLAVDDLGIKTIRRNTFGAAGGSSTQTNLCVHRGVNRSASVIFSWKEGDIEGAEYLWSDKKLKNSAVIIGRYVNTVVDTAGVTNYERRTMVVDADDIDGSLSAAPVGAALTSIITKMQTRGRQALRSQNRVTITRADVLNVSKYQYRKHFHVGDLVSVDGNFGQIASMRVTEYVEIQDENGQTEYPTLELPEE